MSKEIYPIADIVLFNGKIWAASNKTSKDESAVAIKNNIIIYVGNDKDVKNYIAPHTKLINLHKKRVVPGFEDCHAHLLMYSAVPLGSLRRYEPFEGEGGGSAALLFWKLIFVKGFHWLCKITRRSPSDCNLPMLPKFLVKRNWRKMMDALIKMGVTSVTEAGMPNWKHLDILEEMNNDGELKIRFNILLASRILDEAIEKGVKVGDGDEWVRITGVKFYADGWMTPRTAAMIRRYKDVSGKGLLFYNLIKAILLVRRAHNAGLRVATHAIGDRGIMTMLDAYEIALGDKIREEDHRFTIEHATVMRKGIRSDHYDTTKFNLVRRMKELNVTASYQLGFAAIDNRMSEESLGEKRYKYCYAWNTLLKEGIMLAGGSDWPIDTVSPFWGIQRAVTRKDFNNPSSVVCNVKERISIEDAVESLTVNAAKNSFGEDIKGKIEVGKLADIVVLSDDIFKFNKEDENDDYYIGKIHELSVDLTIIDGKIVYLNPKTSLKSFYNVDFTE